MLNTNSSLEMEMENGERGDGAEEAVALYSCFRVTSRSRANTQDVVRLMEGTLQVSWQEDHQFLFGLLPRTSSGTLCGYEGRGQVAMASSAVCASGCLRDDVLDEQLAMNTCCDTAVRRCRAYLVPFIVLDSEPHRHPGSCASALEE